MHIHRTQLPTHRPHRLQKRQKGNQRLPLLLRTRRLVRHRRIQQKKQRIPQPTRKEKPRRTPFP